MSDFGPKINNSKRSLSNISIGRRGEEKKLKYAKPFSKATYFIMMHYAYKK
jgi:hypothetical protein